MTPNKSLENTQSIINLLRNDFLNSLVTIFPFEAITKEYLVGKRDKVYNIENTLLTMVYTATQEDKTLQNSVLSFKKIFESKRELVEQQAHSLVENEREIDQQRTTPKQGRKKLYKAKIKKSALKDLSVNTAAYSKARSRISFSLIRDVFNSTIKDTREVEVWHGMGVYSTDGTYVQMQDTPELQQKYPMKSNNKDITDTPYPQGLLQVIIQHGSGFIYDYKLSNRQVSELSLIYELMTNIPANSVLLADDLYNSYAIFALTQKYNFDIIVPGKRKRKYTVKQKIADGDEIVEIVKNQNKRAQWLSKDEVLPEKLLLRRIEFTSLDGKTPMVIYTTILDKSISKTEIVLKYFNRWDIEITIREIKTLMDVNIIRSKTDEMVQKELAVAFIAYNLIKKIIIQSTKGTAFSPETNIIQKFFESNKKLFIDSKGRIYNRWSTGRYGKANEGDSKIHNIL